MPDGWVQVVFLFFAILAFNPLRTRMQSLVDRFFDRDLRPLLSLLHPSLGSLCSTGLISAGQDSIPVVM